MDNERVSIYLNGNQDIDPDVLSAINEMQADFGFDQIYSASIQKIRAHIAKDHGAEIAAKVKAQMFLPPPA